MTDLMALADACTKHGCTLDKFVERVEADGSIDNPEVQAEARQELEYAAYIVTEFGKQLTEVLG